MGEGSIEVVLGTRNAKKCQEMVRLLGPHGVAVVSVADFPDVSRGRRRRPDVCGECREESK